MTTGAARKWLGIYFLMTTCITGAVILIFGGGTFIPLEESDVNHSFQIVIPVLLGQLMVIFQWIAGSGERVPDGSPSPVPDWAIRIPPISAAVIMASAVVTLFLANRPDMHFLRFGPERFQATLTFVVSILNASTVFLVARLFPSAGGKHTESPVSER